VVVLHPPVLWFDWVSLTLLGELSKHGPQMRERLRAAGLGRVQGKPWNVR
jgi:hypothetical protein